MKIQTDSLFLIGKSHKVCQDYALNGSTPTGLHYIIVSDGCSSSKDTDIGARILAMTAKGLIDFAHMGYEAFGSMVIRRANDVRVSFGLDVSCLDATLLVVVVDEKTGKMYTNVYGDGYLIKTIKDSGDVFMCEWKFQSGAPFYLSYWLHERYNNYKNQYGSEALVIKSFSNGVEYLSLELGYQEQIVHPDEMNFSSLILSSDGLDSFTGCVRCYKAVEMHRPFIEFKNTNGEFLKRRMGKECESLAKSFIYHQDDLGMAALIITED